VNALICTLSKVLLDVVWLYTILLIVYAVLSWFPDLRGRWTYYLAAVIEPVLMPIRRVIPPLGGLDLAFLVLLLVLQFAIRPFLMQEVYSTCFLY
jgi:YggT family protein